MENTYFHYDDVSSGTFNNRIVQRQNNTVQVTSNGKYGSLYLLKPGETRVVCNAEGGCINLSLPKNAPVGTQVYIQRQDQSKNNVFIRPFDEILQTESGSFLELYSCQDDVKVEKGKKGWWITHP